MFSISQFAYRRGDSSTNALVKFQHSDTSALNSQDCKVFRMDVSKVFDLVKLY